MGVRGWAQSKGELNIVPETDVENTFEDDLDRGDEISETNFNLEFDSSSRGGRDDESHSIDLKMLIWKAESGITSSITNRSRLGES